MCVLPLIVMGVCCSQTAYAGSDERTAKYQSIERAQPIYPSQAARTGMTGWVVVEFTITDEGTVTNPVVIDTCAWIKPDSSEDRCKDGPNPIFNDAALQAVLKFKYTPRMVDGVPVNTEGVKNRISFALMDEPVSALEALYQGTHKPQVKKTTVVPAMRERTYRKLVKAQRLIDPERHQSKKKAKPQVAIQMLIDLKDEELNSLEIAQKWNSLAYAYSKLGDTDATINAYHQVLNQSPTPLALQLTSLRALYGLYFQKNEYDKAVTTIDRWLVLKGELSVDATFLKAVALYRLGNLHDSLRNVLATERVARERGKKSRESWWYLKFVLHYELEDWPNAISVLERLNENYPNEKYLNFVSTLRQGGTIEYETITTDLWPSKSEFLPIVKVLPVYPRRALRRGLSGWVVVEFTKVYK